MKVICENCGSERKEKDIGAGAEWQPIETAPKDGTNVLLFGTPSAHARLEVRFLKPHMFTAHWDYCDEAFCMNGGDWMGPFIDASHWMPLPNPPLDTPTQIDQT